MMTPGQVRMGVDAVKMLFPWNISNAVRPTGDVLGELCSQRLRDAGVLAHAVVVAGGHDHPVGRWGVDKLHSGAILDSMGTAEVVVSQSLTPVPAASDRIDTAPSIRHSGTTLLRVEELARNVQWASQNPSVAEAVQRIISGDLAPDDYLFSTAFVPGGAAPYYTANAPAARFPVPPPCSALSPHSEVKPSRTSHDAPPPAHRSTPQAAGHGHEAGSRRKRPLGHRHDR
jgi:hypothetical protein